MAKNPLGLIAQPAYLRRHARVGRMIGPYLDARPFLATDCQLRERHLPQAAHAEFCQQLPSFETPHRHDAGIDDPCTTCEHLDAQAKLGGTPDADIRQGPRTLVHSQIGEIQNLPP